MDGHCHWCGTPCSFVVSLTSVDRGKRLLDLDCSVDSDCDFSGIEVFVNLFTAIQLTFNGR